MGHIDRTCFIHVGLPKTGTTTVQLVVGQEALDAGWNVATDLTHPTLAWDALKRRPNKHAQLEPWMGDGSWDKATEDSSLLPTFISHENLSGASCDEAHNLVSGLDHGRTIAIITWTDLPTLLMRRWNELRKHGEARDFPTWAASFDWRSTNPDHDGSAVRPDAVAARWRACCDEVRLCYVGDGSDAVLKVASAVGLPAMPCAPLNVGSYTHTLDAPTEVRLRVAQCEITTALFTGTVADLTIPQLDAPLEVVAL